jgi:glycosyltransferase involved in cell wall biosynthesis
VTVFASGDSEVTGRHVETTPQAIRPAGIGGDINHWVLATLKVVLDRAHEFDVVHSHLEWWSLLLARAVSVPVVSTFHGRLDLPPSRMLFQDPPDGLVAISASQASTHPDVPWTVIHNGLTLGPPPRGVDRGDGLCFIGRVDPEKGIVDAIDVALLSGRRLRIAAKIGTLPWQRDYHENVFLPKMAAAGESVEFLGELGPEERDRLYAESDATLMPGGWPEPFGLVAIESLACGTPVLARRVGGLTEIIREGIDGWFGDDPRALAFQLRRVDELDRSAISASVIDRFSATRMTDGYEALYRRLLDGPHRAEDRLGSPTVRERVTTGHP